MAQSLGLLPYRLQENVYFCIKCLNAKQKQLTYLLLGALALMGVHRGLSVVALLSLWYQLVRYFKIHQALDDYRQVQLECHVLKSRQPPPTTLELEQLDARISEIDLVFWMEPQ